MFFESYSDRCTAAPPQCWETGLCRFPWGHTGGSEHFFPGRGWHTRGDGCWLEA